MAASHHRRRIHHGFVDSCSRRPPRGFARLSDPFTRCSGSTNRAYHRGFH